MKMFIPLDVQLTLTDCNSSMEMMFGYIREVPEWATYFYRLRHTMKNMLTFFSLEQIARNDQIRLPDMQDLFQYISMRINRRESMYGLIAEKNASGFKKEEQRDCRVDICVHTNDNEGVPTLLP